MPIAQLYELARFGGVGALAVFTDFLVYFALLNFTPIPTFISKGISYIFGNIISFLGHRHLVFYATDKRPIYQIGPFIILYTSTLILNNIVNQLMLSLSGSKFLAWFIAISLAVTINYLGMKYIVFASKKTQVS